MQIRQFVARLRAEPLAQILAQQRVIAEPMPFEIHRLEQQLARGDRLQHALARLDTGYRLAQRGSQPIEYRGAQHESDHVVGQARKHVFEVGGERPRGAGRHTRLPARPGLFPRQHRRRNAQCRRPTLRGRVQRFHAGRAQPARAFAFDKAPRLVEIETQCRRVDFQQFVLCPEPRERQRGIRTGANNHVHVRRCVRDEERYGVVNRREADQMVIVEEQAHLVLDFHEVVDQRRDDGVRGDQRGPGRQADR